MLTLLKPVLASAALALAAFTSAAALADTVRISATLSGASEVPATTSAGTGMVEGSYDKDSHVLTWTVSYAGLSGPVKAGHFHGPAEAGKNAGVALGFGSAMDSPITGSATLTPAQAADLLAGHWYANLHTPANGGGEIRGQVSVAP
jgi:CHRD domain